MRLAPWTTMVCMLLLSHLVSLTLKVGLLKLGLPVWACLGRLSGAVQGTISRDEASQPFRSSYLTPAQCSQIHLGYAPARQNIHCVASAKPLTVCLIVRGVALAWQVSMLVSGSVRCPLAVRGLLCPCLDMWLAARQPCRAKLMPPSHQELQSVQCQPQPLWMMQQPRRCRGRGSPYPCLGCCAQCSSPCSWR